MEIETKHIVVSYSQQIAYHYGCHSLLSYSFGIWSYLNWRAGKLSLDKVDRVAKTLSKRREDYNPIVRIGSPKWLSINSKEVTNKPFEKMFEGVVWLVHPPVYFYYIADKNKFTLDSARKLGLILNFKRKKREKVLAHVLQRRLGTIECSLCNKWFFSPDGNMRFCPACGSKSLRKYGILKTERAKVSLDSLPI